MTTKDKGLITYIMRFNNMNKEQAEKWADKHCGDWRNTPLPRAKRIKSVSNNKETQ